MSDPLRLSARAARRRTTHLLGALVLLAVTGGCSGAPPPPVTRHLVLITIDTLRADRVGAYGAERVATPRLDAIAAAGTIALETSAHAPLTLPSHASIFAGRLPPSLGIRDNISAEQMPADVPLLAEALKSSGFKTGGFVSSIVLGAATGLGRGFDVYSDEFDDRGTAPRFISSVQKRGDTVTREALEWLAKTRDNAAVAGRVFLWLHLFDPHDPYEPPEPYASRYADRPYDGEVAWSDELVGRVDDELARLRMRDDTLLVVTSDHGEGLGEHGETLHGYFVYQSTLRVPLLVRGPGVMAGARLGVTVRLVDLFPTVLDLLAIDRPPGTQLDGRSLATALRGGQRLDEAPTYAESLVPLLHFGWSDLRVLRDGRWKYIEAPRPELYDLANDPGEQTNLAPVHRPRAEAMRSALRAIVARERGAPSRSRDTVSIEHLERLAALGYVAGGPATDAAGERADPKDKLEDFRAGSELMRQGLLRFHDGDYQGSVAAFRNVLGRGVEGFEVHLFLGRGLLRSGRPREAAVHFEEALKRAPHQAAAWEGLADSLAARRDPDAALTTLRRAQQALPRHAGLRAREAQLLRRLGRPEDARQAYETALALAPDSAALHTGIGELLRDMGRTSESLKHLQRAVAIDPESATAWNSLGAMLAVLGRTAESESAFRNAIARDPRNHRYLYNLGFLLLNQRREPEAREWFQKSLDANPSFDPAREALGRSARARRRSER